MNKYTVNVVITRSLDVTVEAENEDAAKREAELYWEDLPEETDWGAEVVVISVSPHEDDE